MRRADRMTRKPSKKREEKQMTRGSRNREEKQIRKRNYVGEWMEGRMRGRERCNGMTMQGMMDDDARV
jgi:hypothetical protein